MKLYYRKLIASSLALSIIPTVLIGMMFYNKSRMNIQEEIRQSHHAALNTLSQRIDEKMRSLRLDLLSFIIENRKLYAYSYSDEVEARNDTSEVTKLYRMIANMKNRYNFVSDIVLSSQSGESVVTTLGSFSRSRYFQEKFRDYPLAELFAHPRAFEVVVPQRDENRVRTAQEINRLVISVSLPMNHANPRAFIFVVLDKNVLFDELITTEMNNRPTVSVYDGATRAMIADFGRAPAEISDMEQYFLQDEIHERLNRNFTVASATSKLSGWEYVAFVPEHVINEKVGSLKAFVLLSALVVLLISLLASFFISSRLYRPLRRVLRIFDQDKKVRNEFEFLMTNIDDLLLHHKQLERRVLKSIPLLQERYLHQLLTEKELSQTLNEDVELYKFEFKHEKYVVLALVFPVPGMVEGAVDAFRAQHAVVYAFRIDFMTVLLLNYSGEGNWIREQAARLAQDQGAKIGIGAPRAYLRQVQDSCNEARKDLLSARAGGAGEVVHGSGAAAEASSHQAADPETIRHRLMYLASGTDSPGLREKINQLTNELFGPQLSLGKYIRNVETLIGVAEQWMADASLEGSHPAAGYAEYRSRMDPAEFPCCTEIQTRAIADLLEMMIVSKPRDERRLLVNNIILYIEENFFRELSLEEIADFLHISYSYASRIFKEYTGQNYSVYLENVRIERAKRLIKEDERSVEKIGSLVGYSNSNTFIKVFKKHTGTTPGRYRKLHHDNG